MKLMTNKNTMLLFLLVISTFLMGIGYAAINSVTGEIGVRTTANVQSGVFITSVEPVNADADDDFTTSQIKYYIGTMMQSTVALSKTDSKSDIQYKVTFYNNSTESSIFLGVEYVEDYEEFYDNLGITFEISGINVGDEIGPKETKELTIIFKYKDGVIAENNILNSYLNFKFGQPNRLIMANLENVMSGKYLNSNVQSTKIEKIEFVLGEVPSEGVIEFFDASEKQDESIIGYYTDEDGNDKYELTFVSTQPIYTNINSQFLFYGLLNLANIQFDNFYTSGTTNMMGMFGYCNSLTSIDVSKFDTSKVTNMIGMFLLNKNFSVNKLEKIIGLENFDTSNVTDMSEMFEFCSSLTSIDLSSFNTSNVTDMSGMFAYCNSSTSIDVSSFNTSNVTDMSGMFAYCNSLTSIDVSSFNTSNVTNMIAMFAYCNSSTSIDVSSFNTSNVTDMSGMFAYCNSLTSIDVSSFNTSNVTNMTSMFWQCVNLTSIDVSSFNTSKVTSMEGMFGCYNDEMDLEEIKGLENFDTSNVIYMSTMFQNCGKLTQLNVSEFNTNKVRNMDYMFCDCSAITTLDISKFDTSNVQSMIEMFYGCNKLDNLKIGKYFITSKVINMRRLFSNCYSLTTLDLSSFNTSKVTDMENMFYSCSNLKTIYVSEYDEANDTGWTTKTVTSSANMFTNCSKIVGGNGTIFNSNYIDATYARIDKSGNPGYLTNIKESGNVNEKNRLMLADSNSESYLDSGVTKDKIESIAFKLGEVPSQGIISKFDASEKQDGSITGYYTDEDGNSIYELTFASTKQIYANIDSKNLFSYLTNLKSIDFGNFSTYGTTNMSNMFNNCVSLQNIDLSNFNTEQVTDMSYMFYTCVSLQNLDLSNFNAEQVTDMSYMFYTCRGLQNIDLSNFNTSKAINMIFMFSNCSTLQSIDLSDFNTSNVTKMAGMFLNCFSLKSLDLSGFNTSETTDMNGMFFACTNLLDLDISSFDTSNVIDMTSMFYGCYNLKTIYVSEYDEINDTGWTTKSVTTSTSMFASCSQIVGGNGTTYNSSYKDAQYARIDKEGSPGYFTDIKDKQ